MTCSEGCCWHRTKVFHNHHGGKEITEICCYCGDGRKYYQPPPRETYIWSTTREKAHGPYKPKHRPRWKSK